jgi:hypothetical protein
LKDKVNWNIKFLSFYMVTEENKEVLEDSVLNFVDTQFISTFSLG